MEPRGARRLEHIGDAHSATRTELARRGGDVLVRAELVVACMGPTGRPVRLPPALRDALSDVTAGDASPPGPPRSRHIQV